MTDSNPENLKYIRFQQRRSNLNNAFSFLSETLNSNVEVRIRNAAVIKAFEMTFELSWKSLKDLLEYKGVIASTPRDVLKEAFKVGYLIDGQTWIELLDHRNELVHVYDEEQAIKAAETIANKAFPCLDHLVKKLNQE